MNTDRKLMAIDPTNPNKNSMNKASTMGGSSDRNQMAFLEDNIDSDTSAMGKSSIYKKNRENSSRSNYRNRRMN